MQNATHPTGAETTMMCCSCGTIRTTRQKIRQPDRHLRCFECGTLTNHRSLVDAGGDWRERENELVVVRGADRPSTPAPAAEVDSETIPELARTMLGAVGIVAMTVPGLNREAWLLPSEVTSFDRAVLVVDADTDRDRWMDLVAETLEVWAREQARGKGR